MSHLSERIADLEEHKTFMQDECQSVQNELDETLTRVAALKRELAGLDEEFEQLSAQSQHTALPEPLNAAARKPVLDSLVRAVASGENDEAVVAALKEHKLELLRQTLRVLESARQLEALDESDVSDPELSRSSLGEDLSRRKF
mmetsp:Transcript_18908/g.44311  ORF Transcript_18908/g.44311 Transcript_18908/m.44311 type:complete len:144 (-) Transcript_18908:485-916(-)